MQRRETAQSSSAEPSHCPSVKQLSLSITFHQHTSLANSFPSAMAVPNKEGTDSLYRQFFPMDMTIGWFRSSYIYAGGYWPNDTYRVHPLPDYCELGDSGSQRIRTWTAQDAPIVPRLAFVGHCVFVVLSQLPWWNHGSCAWGRFALEPQLRYLPPRRPVDLRRVLTRDCAAAALTGTKACPTLILRGGGEDATIEAVG
eukprot:1254525-Rhodomonas_salina.2